jgi:hypothetical protein
MVRHTFAAPDERPDRGAARTTAEGPCQRRTRGTFRKIGMIGMIGKLGTMRIAT